MCSACYLHLEL
uniref:Uncharacterized protein n=1 Tax=Arundo donax TaxID=35708 RepID=A0A0A9T4K9_ARUDO